MLTAVAKAAAVVVHSQTHRLEQLTKEGTNMNLINKTGIVDSVRAVRGRKDVVLYLEVKVHLDHIYLDRYGDQVRSDWIFPIDPSENVNPGDIISASISVYGPDGPRFAPALEVGSSDEEA